MSVDEVKTSKVIQDLIADFERHDGFLAKSAVERLFEKRSLSVEECSAVYTHLEENDIVIVDDLDDDITAAVDLDDVDMSDAEIISKLEQFDLFIKDVSTKLLTREEEIELGRTMELGRRAIKEIENGVIASSEHDNIIDRARQARDKMITSNIRLVLHVGKRYAGISSLSSEDIFQEGIIGLLRAADKYDHTLGFKFSTFATWWIRQAIIRGLRDTGTIIRLPGHIHESIQKLNKAHFLLTTENNGGKPGVKDLAMKLNWTTDFVHFIQQIKAHFPVSLDEPVRGGTDDDELDLKDTLRSDNESPEDSAYLGEKKAFIEKALSTLNPNEKMILTLRFGLFGCGSGATQEEIGRKLGITRERVRQIEVNAIIKMQQRSRAE